MLSKNQIDRLNELIEQRVRNASDLSWLMGRRGNSSDASVIGAENALKASEDRLKAFIESLFIQEEE